MVARGFNQKKSEDFWETFSLTIRYESIRLILAIACAENLKVHQADIDTAYLQAKLHAKVYVYKIDRINIPAGKMLQVHNALYGLKQSGREWYIEACDTLEKFGLRPTFNDPSVFINSDKTLIVGLFVDDMIIAGKSLESITKFKESFCKVHKLKDLGEIYKFLELKIT